MRSGSSAEDTAEYTLDTVNINKEQEDETTGYLKPWVLVHCGKVLLEGISCSCGFVLVEGTMSVLLMQHLLQGEAGDIQRQGQANQGSDLDKTRSGPTVTDLVE